MSKKVAIFQNTITGGGRIQVINAVITILNSYDIVPDIYTFKINRSFIPEKKLKFRLIPMRTIIRGMSDLKIVSLNARMEKLQEDFDLLINSNNSFLYAPEQTPTVSYIHFPRKARVFSEYVHLAFPDEDKVSNKNFIFRLYRNYLRLKYKNSRIPDNQTVLANSGFTEEMIRQYYPNYRKNIEVVYPPVDINKWKNQKQKIPSRISSLGRFSRDKRQLEQIMIARELPEVEMNIIGFVGDGHGRSYFELCENFVKTHRLKNVILHPNLPFPQAKEILTSSKFFIHSLRNEPFGISSVEAVAAGCIPIVHDSGGQKETVEYQELRYKNYQEAIQKITGLLKKDTTNLQAKLRDNNSRFGIDTFKSRMEKILSGELFN